MKNCRPWLRIGIIIAALYLFSQVTPVYLPVILAIIISFILSPIVELLVRQRLWPFHMLVPRGLAVAISILVGIVTIAGVVTFIFLPFINEFNRFFTNLPSFIAKVQNLTGMIEKHAQMVQLPANVQSMIDQGLSSGAEWVIGFGRRALDSTMSFATRIVELVVVPVLTYYFLKDWRELRDAVLEIFPPHHKPRAGIVISEMAEVLKSYIHGQAMVSAIIGLLVFIGMMALKVDYPLVLGLLATLTEAVPIIGPIIGAAPAILLAYFYSPELAVKVIIFFIVLHQLENHVIVPKVIGDNIALHPVVVIISLLIGGQLLGIVGMILAVPVVALLKVLLKHLWRYEQCEVEK